jgi:hypothetical protein
MTRFMMYKRLYRTIYSIVLCLGHENRGPIYRFDYELVTFVKNFVYLIHNGYRIGIINDKKNDV